MTDNLPPLPEFEKWLRSVCFQAPPANAYDLARCAWIEADKQATADVEAMAEEIQRLQNALAFWMPGVPSEDHPLHERVAHDAYLLVGYDGPNNEPSAFELGHVVLAALAQAQSCVPALWAIHVPGPDDYYPAPSEEAANHMASKHNAAMTEWFKANPDTSGNRPPIESSMASAQRWPGSAADHAEEIAVFDYAAWGFASPQPQPVQPSEPVIDRLTEALKRANNQAEHFEREWYLRGDEIEAALPAMREYARKNPKHHFSTDGTEQDPNGAHSWLDRNDKPSTEAAQAKPEQAAQQWRPIETAPKDGTHVLLFWAGEVISGHWWPNGGTVAFGEKGNWTKDRFGLTSTAHWSAPTHWMPLPAAPQPKD